MGAVGGAAGFVGRGNRMKMRMKKQEKAKGMRAWHGRAGEWSVPICGQSTSHNGTYTAFRPCAYAYVESNCTFA